MQYTRTPPSCTRLLINVGKCHSSNPSPQWRKKKISFLQIFPFWFKIWIKCFSFSMVFEHYSHSTVVLNCLLLQKTQTVITGSLFKWCINKVLTFTNLLHNLENYPTFYFQKQLMLIGPEMLLTKTASLEREKNIGLYMVSWEYRDIPQCFRLIWCKNSQRSCRGIRFSKMMSMTLESAEITLFLMLSRISQV